jgi:hypothetical protein
MFLATRIESLEDRSLLSTTCIAPTGSPYDQAEVSTYNTCLESEYLATIALLQNQSDATAGRYPTGDLNNSVPRISGVSVAPRAAAAEGNPNQPPVAVADRFAVANTGSLTVTADSVLGNDTDPNGDPLTATFSASAANGTVVSHSDGSITYTPNAGFVGTDQIGYTAIDSSGLTTTGDIEIAVFPGTASLGLSGFDGEALDSATWAEATPDEYFFDPASTMTITTNGLLENDGLSGGPFVATLINPPSFGTVSLNGDGTFTYTPTAGSEFVGNDSFTYQLVDGSGQTSNAATATLFVVAPPVAETPWAAASPDVYLFEPAESMTVATDGVTWNDSIEGGSFTVSLVGTPSHGAVALNSDGTFTYTPSAGSAFIGSDSFSYQLVHWNGTTSNVNPATVLVSAYGTWQPPAGPNTRPIANPDPMSGFDYSVAPSETLTITAPGLLYNDADYETPPFDLQTSVFSWPTKGSLVLQPDGSFTYTAYSSSSGTDTFRYRAFDGELYSDPATVTITITSPNVAPWFSFTTSPVNRILIEDGPGQTVGIGNITAGNATEDTRQFVTLTATSSDPGVIPHPTINRSGTTATLSYRLVADANTYNPVTMQHEPVTITVTADDGQPINNTFSRTFNVTINPVNDPPYFDHIDNRTHDPNPGTQQWFDITGVVPGPANESYQTVTVSARSGNTSLISNPTVTGTGSTRTLSYTPVAGASGSAIITVTANDLQPQNNLFSRSFTVTLAAPPTVWMSQADPEAREGAANTGNVAWMGSVRFHRSGDLSQALTVNFTTAGSTATYGLTGNGDYGFTNATSDTSFTIPADRSWDDLVIAPIYDSVYDPDERVTVRLVSGTGYAIVSPTSAYVDILDATPRVWMSQADDSATEGAANTGDVALMGSVRFHRDGDLSQPLVVNFAKGGTATYGLGPGQDYGFTNPVGVTDTSFTIPVGKSWDDLVIAPIADDLDEPDETVVITLTSSSNYVIGNPISAFVTILNVGTPRVDIDTDSDNSGAIDGTQAEDVIEMDAPGNVIRLNDDDDDGNGRPDKDDTTYPFNAQGNGDDDLEPIRLSFDAAGNNLAGYTLTLTVSAGNTIKLWKTNTKEPLASTTFTIGGANQIPATIYAEGLNTGTATVGWILKKPDGTTVVDQDSVRLTVATLDLTAYRPDTKPFQSVAVPEAKEETPGVGIRLNGDDDNGNNIPDRLEAPPYNGVNGENDLIKVQVTKSTFPGIKYVLKRNNANINVWRNANRSGVLLVGQTNSIDFSVFASGNPIYVEWVTPNVAGTSATLTLEARTTTNDKLVFWDTIKFVPFQSIVIVFGGDDQTPSDPVSEPKNFGMFQTAIDLYREGYDVRMYKEGRLDDVTPTTAANYPNPILNDVRNAIQKHGQTNVAIMGYSHGGGQTYNLAHFLNRHRASIGTFTIVFTSYIDAIQKEWNSAETRLPPGSQFHVNQYQRNTNTLQEGYLNGNKVPGAAVEVDQGKMKPWIRHETIDDQKVVIDLLKQWFVDKVKPR